MRLALRPAKDAERDFCETLSRANMAPYLAARGIAWTPARFRESWEAFENHMIEADGRRAGLLRLMPEAEALGLRDLQLLPAFQRRGIGTWAVRQSVELAAQRGYRLVRLRVYEENPAKALYLRLGFVLERISDGTAHLRLAVREPLRPPDSGD